MKLLAAATLLVIAGLAQAVPNPPLLCDGAGPCEPPPVAQGCPVQPVLQFSGPVINGAYFYDCGEPTQLRSPEPTKTYWHIGGAGAQGSGFSYCLAAGSFDQDAFRYPEGNVTITTNDQLLYLADTVDGNLTLDGDRLNLTTVGAGRVVGSVICGPNASNVEFNGECICP